MEYTERKILTISKLFVLSPITFILGFYAEICKYALLVR